MFFQLKSLRLSILLYAALPVTVVIALLVAFFANSMYDNLLQDAFKRADREVHAAAAEIERQNLESITVPKIMALAQTHGMFGDREASVAFAKRVLEEHPQFTGVYFGYEPNADRDDGEFRNAAPAPSDDVLASLDEKGRFLPYWYRDLEKDSVIKVQPLVDMETSFYYQGNKNRFLGKPENEGVDVTLCPLSSLYTENDAIAVAGIREIITEPYVYEGKLIVEQTAPVIIDNQFKGIAGVDRALSHIDRFVKELKPYTSADFFLVSRRGRIISASVDADLKELRNRLKAEDKTDIAIDDRINKQRIAAKKMEDTVFGELLTKFYKSEGGVSAYVVTDPVLKDNYLYASAKIPTGNWTLVMRVSKDEILQPVFQTLRSAIVISIFGILAVWLILWWPATSIANRIRIAANAATRVAEGDLTGKITGKIAADESGQLLRSVRTMITNLNGLIGQVKRSSVQLLSTATEIRATSKQQEENVDNFGTSTNEIAAAVTQISSTSRELVNTMSDATDVASDTASLAANGIQDLDGMEETMRQLTAATSAISSKLSVINEKTANISNVANTMTKVADQTNLLSLNACIEAEKAGEYGQGFAVVSREIRRLADQTAAATLDIEAMVRDMQSSVAEGVTEMEKFAEQVRAGVDNVNGISQQLGMIMQRVQALPPRFELVIDGMRSQSDGAGQIGNAISQLAETARQTVDSAREFSKAAASLQQVVMGIKDEVSKFKVDE